MFKLNLGFCLVVLAACGGGDNNYADGEACAQNDDCSSSLCVTAFGDSVELAGGMCTATCTWDNMGGDDCADGEICLRYTATNEYFCFMDCSVDSDCRSEEGWTCATVGFVDRACLPPNV